MMFVNSQLATSRFMEQVLVKSRDIMHQIYKVKLQVRISHVDCSWGCRVETEGGCRDVRWNVGVMREGENGTISAKEALAGRPSMTQVAPLSSYLFVHILPAS